MFWDRIAPVYGIFVKIINGKAHRVLKRMVADAIRPDAAVLECACGTGMLSKEIAHKCRKLTATDFSVKMLEQAEKNCAACENVTFCQADIMALAWPDQTFDAVVAGNVIHLLDEPLKALQEMNRVCTSGGTLIIPTYMNRDRKGRTSVFASTVGKAGADFRRQFTVDSYRQFFLDAGYPDVQISLAEGRIPCAVAVMQRKDGD